MQSDVVSHVCGNWGRWQLRTVLIIFLCKIPAAWFMAVLIFTAPIPREGEFYCADTETIIVSNHSVSALQNEDACFSHKLVQENLSEAVEYSEGILVPCENFVHTGDIRSIITSFDLVCSRTILVALTQTFHLMGVLIGGIIANEMMKSISPRRVMIVGMITQIICGNITGFVSTYWLHAAFRCFSAACCALMFTGGSVIFSDITGGLAKTVVVTLHETYWSIGVILLPAVAGLLHDWSLMYVAISIPTFVIMFLYIWIPDSPRWLLAHGRIEEAKKYLENGVKFNQKDHIIPQDFHAQLENQSEVLQRQNAAPTPKWWTLFQGPKAVRHTICVHWCWAIYLFCYYGTLLNIRTFGRDPLHVNTAVAGLCEIIGVLIGLVLIIYTKRKWLWAGVFNVIASFTTCLVWIVPEDSVPLQMLTAMSSKITISLTLAMLTTCTHELVSADKKKLMVFSAVVWGRIWFMGAPLIGAFNVYGKFVPQTIYAVISFVGGLLSMMISSPRTVPNRQKILDGQRIEISTIGK